MWADISPDMMSDEEFDDKQRIYIRHPPSYRSTILNKFVAKLDLRVRTQYKGIHPRMERKLGSPIEKPLPKLLKHWAKKGSTTEKEIEEITGKEDAPAEPSMDYMSDDSDFSCDIFEQYKP